MLNVIAGLMAGGVAASTNSYESIATYTVGAGGVSSVTFSSIPSTYKHLQIRAIIKDNRSATSTDNNNLRFNSDSGSNYNSHLLAGDGSSAAAGTTGTDTALVYASVPAASIGASIFNGTVLDILDYTNTNKYKVTRSLNGYDANGSGNIRLISGLWMSTAAITQIELLTNIGATSTIQQYSSFALYGIKG